MHILSTNQFKKSEVEKILLRANEMEMSLKSGKSIDLLSGKIIASIFFEPSTRTRLSFETAALRLGASVISAENAMENSSAYKGETMEDTARILSCYADAIVMRHPVPNSVQIASTATETPIINAGDGANQHPSQAFLDLYTIKKEHGRLDNLSIAFVGDILNSRTMRSLVPLLMMFEKNIFYFISPKELVLSSEYRKYLIDNKVNFFEVNSLDEILPKVDILYMTRVQKERFSDILEYEKVKDSFLLKMEHVNKLKSNAIILHPLPRVNEIAEDIDKDKRAAYFRQAQNGLYIRMALLLYVFNL
jgi:aspartate carbamoyltransferase catalytic subunit